MNEEIYRFCAKDLENSAYNILVANGLPEDKATSVARILLEGDLIGRTTHGLALLPAYLDSLKKGQMQVDGSWQVVKDRLAVALWEGQHLPGPWLIENGFAHATKKAKEAGSFTLVIRNSHHTACLGSYLRPVTEAGMVAMLVVSDPVGRVVAPFGGSEAVVSTNPMAFGIPSASGPLLIDVSTSETAQGMALKLASMGELFSYPWLVSNEGKATRDPSVLKSEPAGAIMPLGGVENGHKGFGFGILAESLTHGLSDAGRTKNLDGWINNIFLQVIDPEFLGGLDALRSEMGALADYARSSHPMDPAQPVRMPGDGAMRNRTRMLERGVELSCELVESLKKCATEAGVSFPEAL